MAIIHRLLLYGKDANLQHIYFALSGLILGYFNYGFDILHTVFAIIFTFLTLVFLDGTLASVAVTFIFNMGYLLIGKVKVAQNPEKKKKLTKPCLYKVTVIPEQMTTILIGRCPSASWC